MSGLRSGTCSIYRSQDRRETLRALLWEGSEEGELIINKKMCSCETLFLRYDSPPCAIPVPSGRVRM